MNRGDRRLITPFSIHLSQNHCLMVNSMKNNFRNAILILGLLFSFFMLNAQNLMITGTGNTIDVAGTSIGQIYNPNGEYIISGTFAGKNEYVNINDDLFTIIYEGFGINEWRIYHSANFFYSNPNDVGAAPPCTGWIKETGATGVIVGEPVPTLTGPCATLCNNPAVPTLSATNATLCPGTTSTTISVAGTDNLNDATMWHLYSGSCGGTPVASNASGSFTVSPTSDTDYFVRGEGGCVTPGTCGSISILVPSACITVSGAGTAAVNGEYPLIGTMAGKNHYKKGIYNIGYNTGVSQWYIWSDPFDNYYRNPNDPGLKAPCTGWIAFHNGQNPAPTLSGDCAEPCSNPDVPTLSATNTNICPGATTTISVAGTDKLNDATMWHLYSGSCGGTAVASNASGSFTVSPNINTDYFVRGEGACVTPGTCGSISITAQDNQMPSVTCPNINTNVDANACGANVNFYGTQWASSVIGFSTQYSTTDFAATQALGKPDVYPNYGDIEEAWTSSSSSGQAEYIELAYTTPIQVNFIEIYETYNGGAVNKVSLRNSSNGSWQEVWTGNAMALSPAGTARVFAITIPLTSYTVDGIRLDVDSPNVSSYQEIDAVGISNTSLNISDNCDSDFTLQYTGKINGDSFDLGTTAQTLTVTDNAGNAKSCTFNVTVIDNTNPTLYCPASQTVTLGGNSCDATVNYDFPTGIPVNSWMTSVIGFSTEYGSSSYGSIQALGAPNVYPAHDDNSLAWASATSGGQAEYLELGFDQMAVNKIEIYETYNPGAVNKISLRNKVTGSWQVVWTGTAAAYSPANTARIFTVNISATHYIADAIRLDIDSPAVPGWNEIDAVKVSGYTYDNCPIVPTLSAGLSSGSTFPVGVNTVTFTATDSGSNTNSCSFTVTVEDNIMPIAVCNDISVNLPGAGTYNLTTADINAIAAGSTDNCTLSYAVSTTSFSCLSSAANQVTLTVTDPAGNTDNCTATVNVSGIGTATVTDVTKLEGSGGNHQVFAFKVTRTDNSCPASVEYSTADGTATSTSGDYMDKTGTLTWTAGGGFVRYIYIQVNKDSEVELNENFYVNFFNPTGSISNIDNQAEGTITNDDAATLSINDVNANESNGVLDFTVTLNGAVAAGFSVDYATQDGTATTADGDYTNKTGTLNFSGNDGETQTVSLNIGTDDKVELDETFAVKLSNVQAGGYNVSIGDGTGEATIANDDHALISINDVSQSEGDNGTTTYTFTTTLDKAIDAGISVDYASADGTATTGNNDYNAKSGTLNFAGNANETQTMTIAVNGDCTVESTEDFFVQLSNIQSSGRSVNFSDNEGKGTINDDDSAPTISNCPGNMTVNADASCAYTLGDYTGMPSASGGCAALTISQSPMNGTSIGLGTTSVTLTADDGNGNSASCSFDIQVTDGTAPTAQCQDISVWLNSVTPAVTIAPQQVNQGSFDNCTTVNLVSVSPNTFDCNNTGANSVTLTVEDADGNSGTCTATVTVNANAVTCYADNDGDGFGDTASSQVFCNFCGTGYVDNDEDCDDTNAAISGGTTEICDGIDNDCDGMIDEGFDVDGDGYSTCMGDCNDSNPNIYPGATEVCDGADNNCDGTVDEGFDTDGDGYTICGGDCDDSDPSVNPGAIEVCDGVDNNCDGVVDEGCANLDLDGDGYSVVAGDCDDNDASVNPGATEICDGIDNDCDGTIDNVIGGGTFTGNITLANQTQVDALSQCITIIDGSLTILGTNITNLNALSNLTEVTQNMVVQITDLSDLTGLENLVSIGGTVIVKSNASLTSLAGLDNLTSLAGVLSIVQNGSLNDLGALSNVTSVSSFILQGNASLTSLDGLENLAAVTHNFGILQNATLTDCCAVEPLLFGSGIGGASLILFNDTGCETIAAVNAACSAAPLLVTGNNELPQTNAIELGSILSESGYSDAAINSLLKDLKNAELGTTNLLVYPNPASNIVNIKLPEMNTSGLLNLIDATGRVVMTKIVEHHTSTLQLEIGHLPKGIYLLSIENGSQQWTEKILLK